MQTISPQELRSLYAGLDAERLKAALVQAAETIEALHLRIAKGVPENTVGPSSDDYVRGLMDAARIAEFYHTEHLALADDTIATDPLLTLRDLTAEGAARSDELAIEGAILGSMAHVARRIGLDIQKKVADAEMAKASA